MSVDLRVDWCSYEAAKFACKNYHYSKKTPKSKNVFAGVWENQKYIGAVIFGVGVNRELSGPFNIESTQCCELVRVALTKHLSSVSQIVSKAIRLLKGQSPGLKLIVSYADPEEGHIGVIYQAMNWVYTGVSNPSEKVFYKGEWVHKRVVDLRYGNHKGFKSRKTLPKYRYVYPLDRAMRKQIAPLAKPYPKREMCEQSVEGDTVGDQPKEEGSIPSVRFDATGQTPVLSSE